LEGIFPYYFASQGEELPGGASLDFSLAKGRSPILGIFTQKRLPFN